MRIVFLITVGAFVLSIAIAESDIPIGTTGQYHHQRFPRPIILEPVVKLKSESNPLDWFLNMVSKVMEHPKKSPASIIGPINLPGMAGQVYIRQLEKNLPWQSNHIVIKMVTRDPVTGMNIPLDLGQSYNRFEDSSRRLQKPWNVHGMNNPSGRAKNMQHDFSPSSATNQYSTWQSQYHPRPQNYLNQHSKPFRGSSPNDFHHDDYEKHSHGYSNSHQENYDQRRFPPNNYNYKANQNDNYERFQPISSPNQDYMGTTQSSMYRSITSLASSQPIYKNNFNDQSYKEIPQKSQSDNFYSGQSDFLRPTQIPYPDYTNRAEDHRNFKTFNDTQNNENESLNNYRNSSRSRQVVRNDRMVGENYRNNFGSIGQRERTNFHGSLNSQDSRGFRQSSMTKFDLDDVGGLEVITAPNLNHGWNVAIVTEKTKDLSGKSGDLDLSQDEDSMSMGNGKNLARGESTEHDNNDEPVNQNSRISKSRLSSYKIIDRSHRSQKSKNLTVGAGNENFGILDRMDDKKNGTFVENGELENSRDSTVEDESEETRGSKETTEVVQKVMNLTASNRWRFQEGRQPTRVVKAIYRRRPKVEIVKNSRESTESSNTSENKNLQDSSLEN